MKKQKGNKAKKEEQRRKKAIELSSFVKDGLKFYFWIMPKALPQIVVKKKDSDLIVETKTCRELKCTPMELLESFLEIATNALSPLKEVDYVESENTDESVVLYLTVKDNNLHLIHCNFKQILLYFTTKNQSDYDYWRELIRLKFEEIKSELVNKPLKVCFEMQEDLFVGV